jgi:hypothetical protein
MQAPDIATSTVEERLAWVRERYVCIADCDACGICASFHGRGVEEALADYIEGRLDYRSCLVASRRR